MIYRVVEKMYLYYFAVSQNVDKPMLFVYVYKGRVKPKWVFILRYKKQKVRNYSDLLLLYDGFLNHFSLFLFPMNLST